jgi:hypothetical protein
MRVTVFFRDELGGAPPEGMRKTNIKRPSRTKLALATETIRSLRFMPEEQLADLHGGLMHTSFSCGNNLCTTHY